MTRLLSLTIIATAAMLTVPALACDRHESHASLTIAESAPPVVEQPVQAMPTSTIAVQSEINPPPSSKALGTAWENCNRMRKDQTAYYTQ